METNTMVVPVVKAVSLDWNSIFTLWGPAIVGLVVALASYLKARTAEIVNKETSRKVDDVAVKVDGQHTELLAKTDEQTATILGQAKDIATLQENKRGNEEAKDLKDKQDNA